MFRLASLVAALLVACDPDHGDQRPLTSLTVAELDQACTAQVQAASDDDIRGLARMWCVLADPGEDQCELESLEECTAVVFQRYRQMRCEFQPAVFADARRCDQPVQAVLDCVADYLHVFARFQDVTCETLDEVDDPGMPESCVALEAACPELDADTLEDQLAE